MRTTFRRLSILLIIFFLVGEGFPGNEAFARKRSSRSFSSRRSSSRRSKSSKGLSTSKTSKKSKTYSSRSKTRSKKGSIFNSTSKKTSRGTSFSQAAKRADSKSKFTSSSKGQQTSKTYRQVVQDNKPLSDSLTTEKINTRSTRRKTFYNSYSPSNTYYRYNPAVVYRDPYDNFFFQYVTLTWLFHHWDHIDRSRFDDAKLRELEAKVAEMEAEGVERDPNYTMPEVDPDLQYSDEELINLQEAKEVMEFEGAEAENGGGFGWLAFFLIGLVVVGGVYFVAVRKY